MPTAGLAESLQRFYRPRVAAPQLTAPGAFETRRLRLRRPRPDDEADVFAYASDPLVTRLMDWPTHEAIESSRRFLCSCAEGWAARTEFTWMVTVRPDDRALGAIACRPKGGAVEFGYVLRRDAHGQGIATEAARALAGWLWCIPSVGRIEATCDVENLASARVLEKAGLSRERVLPAYAYRPNLGPVPRDAYLYAWVRPGAPA
jgi:RimJ/RimL family protein N-acetyltransferase